MNCPACGSNVREDARVCLACGEVLRAKVARAERLEVAPAGVPGWAAFEPRPATHQASYPASRLQRIMAALVDAAILAVPAFALAAVTGHGPWRGSLSGGIEIDWLWSAILMALNAGYFIGFPASSWQGTPGKRFLGLRIVTLEGEPITLVQSVGRWASQQVVFGVFIPLAMMVALLGCIAVPVAILILCGDGRSPWDRLAGTMVEG